jgi:general secretion pathway protein E
VPKKIGMPVGCLECRKTGYLGRLGIYEMLKLTGDVRKAIVRDADLDSLMAAAVKEGMKPLRISAAQHVARGLTTMEEVITELPPLDR